MQTEQTYTITLTEAERKAVIGWADASGQGFHYGPAPDGWDGEPAQTARKKLDEAKPDASTTDKLAEWLEDTTPRRFRINATFYVERAADEAARLFSEAVQSNDERVWFSAADALEAQQPSEVSDAG